jgi:hypothetical protein
MGAAVADYDNDGDQDLFVSGVNRNLLFAMMAKAVLKSWLKKPG